MAQDLFMWKDLIPLNGFPENAIKYTKHVICQSPYPDVVKRFLLEFRLTEIVNEGFRVSTANDRILLDNNTITKKINDLIDAYCQSIQYIGIQQLSSES